MCLLACLFACLFVPRNQLDNHAYHLGSVANKTAPFCQRYFEARKANPEEQKNKTPTYLALSSHTSVPILHFIDEAAARRHSEGGKEGRGPLSFFCQDNPPPARHPRAAAMEGVEGGGDCAGHIVAKT